MAAYFLRTSSPVMLILTDLILVVLTYLVSSIIVQAVPVFYNWKQRIYVICGENVSLTFPNTVQPEIGCGCGIRLSRVVHLTNYSLLVLFRQHH